jgi:thymidylate synthase (FAD)
MLKSEEFYKMLLDKGWTPQQTRAVLPNSLKTEIVVTANFREWRHIFKLRCSKAAHPQMREIMIPLLNECKRLIPIIFDDIKVG